MGTQKMFPLIVSMALPPMISMLIQSLYNIIDSIFVARLSEAALSAVSIIYPMQNLTLSLAVGTGIGLNSYIARSLGAGKEKKAEEACAVGFLMTGIHYVIIAFLGAITMKPFIRFFTSDGEVSRLCMDYGYVVMIFCFGQLFHITIEKIFQSKGKMLIPMVLQAVGCVVNIILDPILIFGLVGMPALGVKGAAIATVIGQMSSCGLGLLLYVKGKSGIQLPKRAQITLDKNIMRKIYSVAIPSTMIMAFPSILIAGLNRILVSLSAIAVSVFGIYYKLQTFVYMPATGLIQGIRPVISYNYGAGNRKREKEAIKISLFLIGGLMTMGTFLFWYFPIPIMGVFKASPQMEEMGVLALRVISIGFIPSAMGNVASAVFEAMGKGIKSLQITLLRQLVIILPFAYIMSKMIGLYGVWIAFPIAETVAAVYAVIILMGELRNTQESKTAQGE